MIQMPGGGLVIDTPGMREFHMWLADEGIQEAFPDVIALARQCQFRDCAHTGEKKCAVRAAVDRGELTQGRYESYLKLKHQLDFMASENKRHTYIANKRRAAQSALRQTVRVRKKHPADWDDEDEA
jgi:ribosome biogenesis GTPase